MEIREYILCIHLQQSNIIIKEETYGDINIQRNDCTLFLSLFMLVNCTRETFQQILTTKR